MRCYVHTASNDAGSLEDDKNRPPQCSLNCSYMSMHDFKTLVFFNLRNNQNVRLDLFDHIAFSRFLASLVALRMFQLFCVYIICNTDIIFDNRHVSHCKRAMKVRAFINIAYGGASSFFLRDHKHSDRISDKALYIRKFLLYDVYTYMTYILYTNRYNRRENSCIYYLICT